MASKLFEKLDSLATSAFATTLASLAVAMLVGCSGFGKKITGDFIAPLTSVKSDATSRYRKLPDERTLCVEAAKSVAEQGHDDEAINLYVRAEELGPTHPPLDEELAPLYAQVGDFDAAIVRYGRLVHRSPKNIDLCNNFAWTLMEAKRYDDAIAQAERGLAFDENHNRLRSTLAMVYYRQGDRTKALTEFAKAKDSTAAHHNVAVLDIDAGDLKSAKNQLRQVSATADATAGKVSQKTADLLEAFHQE